MSDRARALSLFRQLYRAAREFPTDNRTSYVRAKVRHEYDAHALEADPTKVTFLLRLAETQLDQVREQASHLAKVFSDPGVHARF